MSFLDMITSFEFSVINKPSKCIASVPHMKSGGIPIFKNFNPAFRFWPECDRSVITVAGLLLVTGLWDQASGSNALSDEKFRRIQSF